MSGYLILFGSAFLAATLLPFYSEVVLVAMVLRGLDPLALWASATLGNTLGALVNYALGRYLLHFQDRRWFPFSAARLGTGQRWFNKYGQWSLLLSWAPVGGDALTYIAGIMLVPLQRFLVLVAIGKALRYALIIYLLPDNAGAA